MAPFCSRIILIALLLFTIKITSATAQDINIKNTGGLKVESVKGKTIILSFNMTVENLSSKSIGVKIKKGKVYRDGEYAGTFRLLRKLKLKKKGDNNLKVEVEVTLDQDIDLMKEGLAVLTGKKTELQATGLVKATWFIFWKKFPFDMKENVSMQGLF